MTDTTSGPTRPFRFGIVAPFLSDLATWRGQVRRIADHGYSTVLMPDFPQLQPSPAVALAVAATVADVRVGTWVYAAPLRAPWLTAWEAHSLTVLTQGRFEMGIGAGRPGIEDEPRAAVEQRIHEFHTSRDVELSMHIPVVGNTVSPFMAPPQTDTAALRAADSLAYLPADPSAAADERAADATRPACPTSPSAPTPPTRSPRSSPNCPAGRTLFWHTVRILIRG
ncbi:LLM class flavin-dependent oxidoreductase [Virgisporangium aurantiacum]|uniref:Luciferase-like domain-containing protein n=1 Tax=Virgisporangium aurantiacum TaxID=175570 RepID=A0A8J3Z6C5_9ACTN|nr:LLM class flavin-dependent oxidoreductase [Virgisporangium aurantiacum]GIJ57217.1 hypothetical protein Vau01_047330 [Virgisporangium aurantiacum]